jgi:hypothetical protein
MAKKEQSCIVLFLKGGPGSGDFDHKGRPGERGGSAKRIVVTRLTGHEIAGDDVQTVRANAKEHGARFNSGVDNRGETKPLLIHNPSMNRNIGLSKAGVKHGISGGGVELDQYRAVAGLPSLLHHAVHTASEPDRRNRRNITAVHRLVAPLTIADRKYAAHLVVRENGDGAHRYYHHELTHLQHLGSGPDAPRLGGNPDGQQNQKSGGASEPTIDLGSFLDAVKGALAKALAAGERWITIRAPGHEKGQPVLIRQEPDGAARVIGGAGGKLNHLKLTSVRSEADYKQEASRRVQVRAEVKKPQRELDKRDGLVENKTAARQPVRDQVVGQRNKFIKTVAETMGWNDADLRFPEEKYQNASEAATKKAAEKHLSALFARAKDAVDMQRKRLVEDGELRQQAGLGEVPLTGEKPDQLSVQDLDPVQPATKGLGYSTDYGKRAADRGLTAEGLAEEAAAAKPVQEPAKAVAADARKATAQKIAAELKEIRDPGPPVDPHVLVDGKKAVALLKAAKELKEVEKAARKQSTKIDEARQTVEPKAYLPETISRPVDEDVVKDLDNELHTIKTRAFLEEVGRQAGGADSLGRHVGVGAYNSINALALAAGGASLVDRSVVDVLGVAGAAEVLARRLKTDMTAGELDNIRGAMERFHVDHYMQLSDSALREARECQDLASEIELGEVSSTGDLVAMQEMNARRRDLVQSAQRTLGTALGEMEANAALVAALGNPRDHVQVSLGKTSIEDAIKQARAIGLDRGDYQIDRVGASTLMKVTGAGMDKLAKPIAKADLQRTKTAMDIIEGRKDEDGWLPQGVADRPDMAMNIPPGTAPQLAKPFPKQPKDMNRAVEDFIGQRAADGSSPADIVAALLSEDTLQAAGDRQAFMAEVDRIAPLYGEDGKMIRAETHQAAFEKLAESYCERAQGADLTPLHRQQFKVDDTSVDALHRALAEHSEGPAAFKPVGDLTPQDQGALRAAFASEYGKSDPAAEGMRRELAEMDARQPEKEVEDTFGRGPNPQHAEWLKDRNALAERLNRASMTWGKYLTVMGSPTRAYAAKGTWFSPRCCAASPTSTTASGRIPSPFKASKDGSRPLTIR